MSEDADEALDAVRALLAALENSENLHYGYVQHLAGELRALLPEAADDLTRGSAFDGRLIAIEGEPRPEPTPPEVV